MLPSSKTKNKLFTYNFPQPVIYKKFFNIDDPNSLIFSSGLYGGCLFPTNIAVSALKGLENQETFVTEDSTEYNEVEENIEAMVDYAEKTQTEEEVCIESPKPKLKLLGIFSSYLQFLRKSVFYIPRGPRAKVITWSKGMPTVKNQENKGENALEKVFSNGEYMAFERVETYEDSSYIDYELSSQYPHVYSAFQNNSLLGNRHSLDRGDTCGVLPEQIRRVQGYTERMGHIYESETGELAIQFPRFISSYETYRDICVKALKESSLTAQTEEETAADIELEGLVSYATESKNTEIFHECNVQFEDEQFEESESLDCMSFKSFNFDEEDNGNLFNSETSTNDALQAAEVGEGSVFSTEPSGFSTTTHERQVSNESKPWDGLGVLKDCTVIAAEQSQSPDETKIEFLDKFQDYISNNVPSRVERENLHVVGNDENNAKRVDQLQNVMLKCLGHFWGLEEDENPYTENVSKFQHVFTPLKLAATK